MGYTPVKTVATGEGWTAKDMNTYVRDNFAAGIPDLFTTKGDIAAASGADAAVRIPAGGNGAFLFADSGQPGGVVSSLPAQVSAKADNTAYILTLNAWTKIGTLLTENYDNTSSYSSGRFTAPHAGYFIICFSFGVEFVSPDASLVSIKFAIYKNGSIYSIIAANHIQEFVWLTDQYIFANGTDIISLVGGDYIELYYYIESTRNSFYPAWDLATTRMYLSIAPQL